jgi:hypothetical protein
MVQRGGFDPPLRLEMRQEPGLRDSCGVVVTAGALP